MATIHHLVLRLRKCGTMPSWYGNGQCYLCLSSSWNAVNYTTGVLTSNYKAYSSTTAWISSSADLLVLDILP